MITIKNADHYFRYQDGEVVFGEQPYYWTTRFDLSRAEAINLASHLLQWATQQPQEEE